MQKNTTDVRISNVNQVQALAGNCCGNQGLCGNCEGICGGMLTLEAHLEMCAQDERFSPLWTSWKTEKAEYEKKLKAVDKTFTTYSSHDADHSEMIVRRIEALLGSARIRLLSPTDTWLILQCAYTHDLGMCVTEQEKEDLLRRAQENPEEAAKILADTDYQTYVEALSQNENKGKTNLHNGTKVSAYFWQKRLEENEIDFTTYYQNVFNGSDFSKALYYYNLTVMNYFRKKHAERSYRQIREEATQKTYGDLFPLRLRYIIADIDLCHGLEWSSVMNLAQEQNGFDNDFIHPRFVAALLRLGDLLDLDSNRFNPFLYGYVRNKPLSSQIHRIKHMTVTDFLVNPKEIRIVSKFDSEQVRKQLEQDNSDADGKLLHTDLGNEDVIHSLIISSIKAAEHWMNMIRADSQEFALSWDSIAPPHFPGHIAVLNQHEIYLDGRRIKETDLNLSYEISSSRASQIIEGSGLYKSALAFLRELIQNAVDATKIQVYFEICEDFASTKSEKLESYQSFMAHTEPLRNEHKIEIRFLLKYPKESTVPEKLIIEVEDRGIGISEDRLSKMKNIGNIIDLKLKNSLTDMPEWMRPTGDFGIGMQSVFSYTDRFQVITRPRKREDGKYIERRITFNSTRLGGDIVSRDVVIADINDPAIRNSALSLSHGGTKIRIELNLTDVQVIHRLFSENATKDSPALINIQDRLFRNIQKYVDETFVGEIIPFEFQFSGIYNYNTKTPTKKEISSFKLNSPLQFRETYWSEKESIQVIRYWEYKAYNMRSDQEKSIFYSYNDAETKDVKSITVHFRKTNEKNGRTRLYFRGIAFEADHHDEDYFQLSKLISIPYFDCCINILCDKASNVIEINRDRIVREKYVELCMLIKKCLYSFFEELFKKLVDSDLFFGRIKEVVGDTNIIWSYFYTLFLLNEKAFGFSREQKEKLCKLFSDINRGNLDGALLDVKGKRIYYDRYPISGIVFQNDSSLLYTDAIELDSIDIEFISDDVERQLSKNYVYMIQNWFSQIFMLYYRKLYVIKPKGWIRKPIKIYQLTNDKQAYPEIDRSSYRILIEDIIQSCLQRRLNGQITDQYYPSFPAIAEFDFISIEEPPIGISPIEKDRFTKWIISPLPLKALTKGAISNEEIEEYLNANDFLTIVEQIKREKEEQLSTDKIKEAYRLFLGFIDYRTNLSQND